MNTELSIKQQKAHGTWHRNELIRDLVKAGARKVDLAKGNNISQARVSQILKFKEDKKPSLFRPTRLFERLLNMFKESSIWG